MTDVPQQATQHEDSRPSPSGSDSGLETGDQVCGRFVVEKVLGRGASGEVLSVHELPLDRSVAMKVLRGAGGASIARFMREARLTARIDHPNVPPVHFMEFLPHGGLLFTMRRLDGKSLGDAIRQRHGGGGQSPIDTVNATIIIIQRVCDALSRAHALGIVHRDVKPDNIMLGAHGEVALVDWGECRLLSETDSGPNGSTVGTPAYMSPEQARGEPADERSDVYALGATLYHALAGLLPVWHVDPDEFWKRKRTGTLDELPPEVEQRLPRHLLAICRRAMAPDPTQRYGSASGFATDLERFQAGLAVDAHPDSLVAHLLRWYRRHRLPVWSVTSAMIVSLTCGWLLWESHLRAIADWGRPIVDERFDDVRWTRDWILHAGEAEVRDGRLVTTRYAPFLLMYREILPGAAAIEFEGEMLPGCQPSDLSVFWCSGREDVPRRPWEYFKGLHDLVLLQAGGYANTCAMIFTPSTNVASDYAALRLEQGRRYRIRAEIDGSRLSLHVDGRKLCEATVPMPLGNGHLGIYGFFDGKAFDNVRIWIKGQAETLPATSIGDALYRLGRYSDAIAAYTEVERSLANRRIAIDARYRRSLALVQSGDASAGRMVWESLAGGPLATRAGLHLVDADAAAGDHDAAIARLDRLAAEGDASERRQCAAHWALQVGTLLRAKPRPDAIIDRYLALRERRLDDASFVRSVLADVLASRSRYRDVLATCPDIDHRCAHALVALGRFEEASERYPTLSWQSGDALLQLGRADEVIARYPADDRLVAEALLFLGRHAEASNRALLTAEGLPDIQLACGRFQQVLDLPTARSIHRIAALRSMGRLAEAPELFRDNPAACAKALLALGRYDEVLQRFPDDQTACAEALLQTGRFKELPITAATETHRARAAYYTDPASYQPPPWEQDIHRQLHLEVAVGRGLTTDELALETDDLDLHAYIRLRLGRLQEVLQRYQRQRWACCQALLLLGRPDEVLRRYPEQWQYRIEARILMALHTAIEGRIADGAREAASVDGSNEGHFGCAVMPALLRRLAGEPGSLAMDLAPVLAIRHRGDVATTWYDAALLAGQIDTAEYLAQPCKPGIQERLQLSLSIRSDLAGDRNAARSGYRAWTAASPRQPALDAVMSAFVAWRTRLLTSGGP